MVIKKDSEGSIQPKDYWSEKLVEPISAQNYAKEVAETEKLIVYAESNAGKTRFYLMILQYLKKMGWKKEDILMCIIFPDRPTGLTKLYNLIPKEYVDRVFIFPINTYEELISATSEAEKKLAEHFKKTGKLGWLVNELLDENWRMSQDWYCREAYGVGLGEYFAQKRQSIKAVKEDASIFRTLEGWTDWPIIKWSHNFNWIDKIKRFPYNVLFTSEVKEEGNKESIFFSLGLRPAGEKDNLHRVDGILYLKHEGDKFTMQAFKLTGYDRLYSAVDITGKNGYEVHRQVLQKFEAAGYKSSAIEELEKEAGIPTPPKTTPKPEETIKVISGTPTSETTATTSKEDLTKKDKKSDVDWEVSF